MRVWRKWTTGAVAGLIVAASMGAAQGATARRPGHCAPPVAGGDWPSYGHDGFNSRYQPAAPSGPPAGLAGTAPRWAFSVAAHGGSGIVNNTPVEAAGCVYADTSTGDLFALNADDGSVVWHDKLATPGASPGYGGTIVGSPAVWNGDVFVLINEAAQGANGPHAVALAADTGTLRWRSPNFDSYPGAYTNASPTVMPVGPQSALLFAGFSAPEGDPVGRGGFVLLRTDTGALAAHTYTNAPGRGGGGIWSTAAFDPASDTAYVGGGNPSNRAQPDPHSDSILQIDVRPGSGSFGRIIHWLAGNADQYTGALAGASSSPACTATSPAVPALPADDPLCGQLDLDFGASPNLFRVGRSLMVGELQKSGVYWAAHIADAGLQLAWSQRVGATCSACNAASTSVDPSGISGVATPGGTAFSLSAIGDDRWLAPVGDGVHFESLSSSGGVVYTLSSHGELYGFSEDSGQVVLHRPLALDTHVPMAALTSAGIAIARHTLYVAADGGAIASAGDGGSGIALPGGVPTGTGSVISDGWILAYGD